MHGKLKTGVLCALEVLIVSSWPVLFLYLQNANEAGFSEIGPVLAAFVAFGWLVLAIAGLASGSASKGALIASVFALLGGNYALIEEAIVRLLPNVRYWHALTIVVLAAAHFAVLTAKKMPKSFAAAMTKSLAAVFGGLILLNAGINAPQLVARWHTEKAVEQEAQEPTGPVLKSEDPNVYLMIFDEYSNFPQLQEYYGYDNALLKDFLEEHGFAICYTGHNESIMSNTVQTNLVNLEYVVDNYDYVSEKNELRKHGRLFSLMRDHGYEVRIYETEGSYGGALPVSGKTAANAKTINGETLSQIVMKKTPLYPFYASDSIKALEGVHEIVDYMSDPAQLPESGTFTLVYLCFPHQPFIVDGDGMAVAAIHREDWDDPQYYLGQLEYATKLMLRMLGNIVENDPDSVILVMSDHGARASTSGEYMRKFPIEVMNNSLNAVYFRSEEIDIEGLSLVNTLRAVLNRLWGTEFDMLQVPEDTTPYDVEERLFMQLNDTLTRP